jgi:serine/threonine protein kinase
MNFSFPNNKALFQGRICDFKTRPNGYVLFESIDILKPKDNIIQIDKVDYVFTYINSDGYSKGGNSIILKLFESQRINDKKPVYDNPDLVLKILKVAKTKNPRLKKTLEKRFEREVSALKKCQKEKFRNIINIETSGICKIHNPSKNKDEEFDYYAMEYAEEDLRSFVEKHHEELTIENKVGLCLSLCRGLVELDSLKYYHRDIKPDNIFIVGKTWKIGDLGLIGNRDEDSLIDEKGKAIGPRGWMSPEAMNKHLCQGQGFQVKFNCTINHQSDIFQLGKVFWYIFQHNAPIGSIKMADFKAANNRIYPIIRTMLNHSLERRYNRIEDVIKLLQPVEQELLKTH